MQVKISASPTRNKHFRSAGETQIARCLDRHSIAYRYEHPLAVLDRGKVRIWYPDFQLPGYGVLIEYGGVNGDVDYAAALRRKQSVYEANGLTALVWTPEHFQGDWPARLLDGIEGALVDRLYRFRAARCTATARSLPANVTAPMPS